MLLPQNIDTMRQLNAWNQYAFTSRSKLREKREMLSILEDDIEHSQFVKLTDEIYDLEWSEVWLDHMALMATDTNVWLIRACYVTHQVWTLTDGWCEDMRWRRESRHSQLTESRKWYVYKNGCTSRWEKHYGLCNEFSFLLMNPHTYCYNVYEGELNDRAWPEVDRSVNMVYNGAMINHDRSMGRKNPDWATHT